MKQVAVVALLLFGGTILTNGIRFTFFPQNACTPIPLKQPKPTIPIRGQSTLDLIQNQP